MKDQVTGIILAGGAATRFGGKDKGLHRWRDRSLIEHSLLSLEPQLDELIISCNRNQKAYAQFGFETVIDQRKDFQGPLAGIEAGLLKCKTKYALIYACDQLASGAELVSRLRAELEDKKLDIVCVRNRKRIYYLSALLKVELLPSLQTFLNDGNRKVADWYNESQLGLIDLDGVVHNINTEADLSDLN